MHLRKRSSLNNRFLPTIVRRDPKIEPQQKRPPEGGLSVWLEYKLRSDDTQRALLAISEKANPEEAEDHHGPGRGLGHRRQQELKRVR